MGALLMLVILAVAGAQTRQGDVLATASATSTTTLSTSSPGDIVPDDQTPVLARSTKEARVLSKNEAYNRARLGQGRLGVRLGNDKSYRITGN